MAEQIQNKQKKNITLFGLLNNADFSLWFVVFCLFCVFIYVLRSVLMPFVLGILLGYLFDPLATKFEKLKISRTMASILVFLLVIAVVLPVLIVVFAVVSNQLGIFIEAMPTYMASFAEHIQPILSKIEALFPSVSTENIKQVFSQNISQTFQFGGKLVQGLMKNSASLINLLSLMLITPVVAFYMLRDWNVFVQKINNLLPQKSKKSVQKIFRQIDGALSGFIRGQLSVCLILGLYYAIALRLVGLELGVLVGFIAGVISFIPYVGSITGFVLSIILALSQFGDVLKIVEVIAVFLIGQFVEGNFLTPKLVGDKIGLHPVWVMFSLLTGGVLLGFLGLMIAVPTAAIIAILLRAFIKKYQASSLYLK